MAILVRFNDNWADEIDLEGVAIYKSEKDFENDLNEFFCEKFDCTREDLSKWSHTVFDLYVGSNEEITYKSTDDFRSCFSITEITDEEYNTVQRVVGNQVGYYPI